MLSSSAKVGVGIATLVLSLLTVGFIKFTVSVIYRTSGNGNSYKTSIAANVTYQSGTETNSANNQSANADLASEPSIICVYPSPSVKTDAPVAEHNANVTDHWISERSKGSYFFRETNNNIEMFANDSRHQRRKIGDGVRAGKNITLQVESTLDDVNGVLKLTLSDDGNHMKGRFTVLDDATKEAEIRMVRVAP